MNRLWVYKNISLGVKNAMKCSFTKEWIVGKVQKLVKYINKAVFHLFVPLVTAICSIILIQFIQHHLFLYTKITADAFKRNFHTIQNYNPWAVHFLFMNTGIFHNNLQYIKNFRLIVIVYKLWIAFQPWGVNVRVKVRKFFYR